MLRSKIEKEKTKVLGNLDENKKILEQKVDYICVIDRSGSMSGQMEKINKAAEDFLLNLKKTWSKNFFFTVIYFDDEGYLKGDTLPLSNYSSFSQFLDQKADGGTDYSKGFELVQEVVRQNWQDFRLGKFFRGSFK